MGLFDRDYMGPRRAGSPPDDGRPMIWALIAVNVFIWLAARSNPGLFGSLALTSGGIRDFRLYQLLSAGFFHLEFTHIFFNMWGLYLFGTLVGPHIGGVRFLWLYVIGAVAGNLLFLVFNWTTPTILYGASGAVCAIMMAAALLEPKREFVLLFLPFFPLKTMTMVVCFTILEILFALSANDGIAHLAHLGGFLGGYAYMKLLFRNALPWDPLRHRLRPGEWKQPAGWGGDPHPGREAGMRPGQGRVSPRELDALLDKISRNGINSLSEEELARLRQAREEMRGGNWRQG